MRVVDSLALKPVRSRQLGKSLRVNKTQPKTCPYSCVYCQQDRTSNITVRRGHFVSHYG